MSLAATDLIVYTALNEPQDEVSTAGGAIDPDTRVVFTQLAANDTVQVVSSNAGDTTQKLTVTGRNAAGTVVSEQVTLNGTTAVNFAGLGTIERLLTATLDNDCAGTVTVRRTTGPTTIGTIPAGERGFIDLFAQSFAAAGSKTYYAKVFFKNTNGSFNALAASVLENADPTGLITFALEDTINDTHTVANRLTAPTHVTAFGSIAITLNSATGTPDLAAGSAIGIWLKLSLGAGNVAEKSTYTLEMDATSS